MQQTKGFTLIEMMVVVAIIAILALMALPSPQPLLARQQVSESLSLIEDYKKLSREEIGELLKTKGEKYADMLRPVLLELLQRLCQWSGAFVVAVSIDPTPERQLDTGGGLKR